jgi:uncharacterized protein (TIGR02145 family)
MGAAGGAAKAGRALKSGSRWDGTDTYGFEALPAGRRAKEGTSGYLGTHAMFWSATEYDAEFAWVFTLRLGDRTLGYDHHVKPYGYSVRCLKDAP